MCKTTEIKNSIISYLRVSLLSPLSTDTQSYTKSLKLKVTYKNTLNFIYKVKSYFPQPAQGAGHTTYHFVLVLWKLDCCILQRLERESRFLFSKKYFIFLKWFLNSSEGIWQGQLSEGRGSEGCERRQLAGENSVCTVITNTKTFDEKMFLIFSSCHTVSSITFLWYDNSNLNNCFHFHKKIKKLKVH